MAMLDIINQVVAVENLYNLLYNLLMEEFDNLSIGYGYNMNNIIEMKEIVMALDYLEKGKPTQVERDRIENFFVNPVMGNEFRDMKYKPLLF